MNNVVNTEIFQTRRAKVGKIHYMASKTHDLLETTIQGDDYWTFENEEGLSSDHWDAWIQVVRCKATGKEEAVLLAGWGYWEMPPKPKFERTSYFAGDFVATRVIKPKYDCNRWKAIEPLKEMKRVDNTAEGIQSLQRFMEGFEEDCVRPDFLRG